MSSGSDEDVDDILEDAQALVDSLKQLRSETEEAQEDEKRARKSESQKLLAADEPPPSAPTISGRHILGESEELARQLKSGVARSIGVRPRARGRPRRKKR